MAQQGKTHRTVREGAVAVILTGAMLVVMVPGAAEAPEAKPLAVIIPIVGLAFLEERLKRFCKNFMVNI